ncbi:MAG TPA: hypothetical protein VMF89_23285 [Polyangiales bacterium]|nr:hypothetical protein [Polyangiales bacterium]
MSPVSPLNVISRFKVDASPVSKGRAVDAGRLTRDGRDGRDVAAGGSNAALDELLAVPARLVSALPVPVCLRLRVPGSPVPVMLWTGAYAVGRASTPVLADIIVFDGAELEALVTASEADRLWHADFLGLCFEKWRTPDVPVRAAELLGGANQEPDAGWSLGRVFARLGIEVETFELEAEPVARPLHAAA